MDSLPSPISSPSTPKDGSSLPTSRKRQRSQSMESQSSSSSLKRSGASPEGRSPHADDMSTLSLSDSNHNIDAYMAEQGEGDTSDTISQPRCLPEQKVLVIDDLNKRSMEIGDTWYLVSKQWYKRWRKACTGEVDKGGPVEEKDVGFVDNSSLCDQQGNITSSLVEGQDVEFVHSEAWHLFVIWYGQPQFPLPRKVVGMGLRQEKALELFPPRVKVLLVDDKVQKENQAGEGPTFRTVSSSDSIKLFLETLVVAVCPNAAISSQQSRVWTLPTSDTYSAKRVTASSISSIGATLLQAKDELQTVSDACIESGSTFAVEFANEDGKWLVDTNTPGSSSQKTGKKTSFQMTIAPEVPPPLFSPENNFFDRMSTSTSNLGISSNSASTSKLPSTLKSTPLATFGSGSSSSAGTKYKHSQDPGTIGLGNMGNTCFMSSALQCLAHSKELTDYFLQDVFQSELNPDNPLGMHGAIAEAFGALLQRIWDTSSPSSSYTPREFKSQLQRFAPQFSGYQQHDSQEFLAFLLDGLHEDLNRVLKKPYFEKPDWEGGGDMELVELAKKNWNGYISRNDSVIVDLFQGQFQSTLVCPECEKVSITFDPFMYLTLPLPVQKKWRHTALYIPWDLNKPHVKVPVEIGRDASFRDLRHLLGRWMGCNPENLLTLEIFSSRFYKNLDDSLLCGEMSDNDVIVCFELPCNSQQSRTYKKQPDDPFILPLLLCDATSSSLSYPRFAYSRNASLFGYPSVIVIDRKQATSLEAMYDAVIERLQRWTSNARDLYTWEAAPSELADQITDVMRGNAMDGIKENGDVSVQHEVLEEGDIADEKGSVLEPDDVVMNTSKDLEPHKTGPKQGVFTLRVQSNQREFGTASGGYTTSGSRFDPWSTRLDEAESNPILLREGDAFFCEFDDNMKAYYFGEGRPRWEHARWDIWEEFIHPEYAEAKKASAAMKNKGISIQDCLEEFTHEEQLGEDDLWYCPRCKKHQQATKKFDLWKAPDILVVHLKRFSNSRTLRDKIDAFVDFPLEGLDLSDKVQGRQVAARLEAKGIDIGTLGLDDIEEDPIYDLFGVDEHMGGLGGGHYRAYAQNHITNKWYHFDDSYVRTVSASEAVNANAYLLFYRRRTDRPLGGKTHQKIEEARIKRNATPSNPEPVTIQTQLPTPPNESPYYMSTVDPLAGVSSTDVWPPTESFSSSSSPPALEEAESSFSDNYERLGPLEIASQQFDFPDPEPASNKASPSSSVEAVDDNDDPLYDDTVHQWQGHVLGLGTPNSDDGSPAHRLDSPTASSISDMNPFADVNAQKHDNDMDSTEIPMQQSPLT